MTPPRQHLWRYDLRIGHYDWATVVIGQDGFFAAASSWGGYAHRWPAIPDADPRRFFLRVEHDYMLSKLCGGKDVYDGAATCRNMKRAILEARRQGNWTADRAREEWDRLAEYSGLDSREDYALWYQHTTIDCAYEHAVYVHPAQARGFVANVMPALAEAIRAELRAETLGQPSIGGL